MCMWGCGCGCVCCFGGTDGCIPLVTLTDVCQCCCLLMFACLPIFRHFPCCKTWWIKNLNLNRYKKELQQATEREKALERSKTQVELDWQRRCEELERRQYNKSEDLITSLTQARDEVRAQLLVERKSETEWLLAFENKIQTQKGSNECLFILTLYVCVRVKIKACCVSVLK